MGNSPVNSLQRGQRCVALIFSLICAWTNGWVDGDLRHHHAHYDVTLMRHTTSTLNLDGPSGRIINIYIYFIIIELWIHDTLGFNFSHSLDHHLTSQAHCAWGSEIFYFKHYCLEYLAGRRQHAIDHFSDVTAASWCLKSYTTRQLLQQLVQAISKVNLDGQHNSLFVGGIHWSSAHSSNRSPVMQNPDLLCS